MPRCVVAKNLPRGAKWAQALDATRSAWSLAYDRLPPARHERAIALIATDPERDVALIGSDRICPICGDALAVSKPANAVYCSRECQRAANRVAA